MDNGNARLESRLNGSNYCTVQKVTLNKDIITLEADVFGTS